LPSGGLSVIQPPQMAFPTPDAGDKKFNSRLVAPIQRNTKPIVVFGGGLRAWNYGISQPASEVQNGVPFCQGAGRRSPQVIGLPQIIVVQKWAS